MAKKFWILSALLFFGCQPDQTVLPSGRLPYSYQFYLRDFTLTLDSLDLSSGYSACRVHLFIPVAPALDSSSKLFLSAVYSQPYILDSTSVWYINNDGNNSDSIYFFENNPVLYDPVYPVSGKNGSTFNDSGLFISITGFEKYSKDSSAILRRLDTLLDSTWVQVQSNRAFNNYKEDIVD